MLAEADYSRAGAPPASARRRAASRPRIVSRLGLYIYFPRLASHRKFRRFRALIRRPFHGMNALGEGDICRSLPSSHDNADARCARRADAIIDD